MGDLSSIVSLKNDYNFRLLVDDAHGFGTMGERAQQDAMFSHYMFNTQAINPQTIT